MSVARSSRAAAGRRSPAAQNRVRVRRQSGLSTGIQRTGTCAATPRAIAGLSPMPSPAPMSSWMAPGFVTLEDDFRRQAAGGEEPVEQPPVPVSRPGGDERLPGEVVDDDRGAARQPVPERNGHQHGFVEEPAPGQALVRNRLRRDAEVDLVGPQGPRHRVGGQLVQAHLDVRVGPLERGERPGEREEGFRRQPHGAEALTRRVGDRAPPRVELPEGTFDVAAEEPAGVVEAEPAGPVEQRRAELGLQPRDRAAQRRLGDAQLFGRPAEVFQPGHHEELPQRSQVHVMPSAS